MSNVFDQFGGEANVMKAYNSRFSGMTPEQAVKQCMNNGIITQDKFEYARQMANKLTGKNL